jgi:6-pyruvoyl-tetrahydropterin synthase
MSASSPPAGVVRASNVVAIRPPAVRNDDLQATIARGMVYELAIDSFFGASHAMRPSGERHTHSFRVQAAFVTNHIDPSGMTVGFRDVSDLLNHEAHKYANEFLNDIEPFTVVQATGENLAAVIFHNLDTAITESIPHGPALIAVTLWENPTSYIKVGRAGGTAR